jgi:PST family polysaccharide transporter
MTQLNPKVESPKGLANVAAFGAAWTIAQAVLNKAATLVAMYVIALQLSPDEFGMAALTLSIGNFLVVLPPLTMSDLMIAEQIGVSERVRLGQRLAIRVGVITTIGIIALSPAVASLYSKYPFAMLAGLIMAFSVRPSIEGMAVAPLSQLRVESRFGVIALIDGSAQLVATVIMVALAFMGTGAISLIVPQVIAIAVRAICYRIAVRRTTVNSPDDGARSNGAINGLSFRHLLTLGSAQYVHNILYSLPVLVLGYFSSEAETGLYAFAFQFASQANGIVSCQLGVVLQPIFGKLKGDLVRQTSGFLRSMFALVFKPEWQPACKIFIMLSLVEAISFVVAPTLALLKSQQKFRVFFLWQVIQCAVSLVAFSFAAHYMGGVGVAVAGAILWATSLSFAVWFGIHKVGGTLWSAIKVLLVPWTTALPFAGVAWLASHFLTPFGNWGMGISIFIVGPIVLILSVLATRISQPETYAEFAPIIFRFLSLPLKSLKAKSLSGNAAE